MIGRLVRHPLAWLFAWFLLLPNLMAAVGSTASLGTEIVVFTLLAIAYNLLMGYTGLVSFGHSAFFGLGGYGAGLAQVHFVKGMVVPLFAGYDDHEVRISILWKARAAEQVDQRLPAVSTSRPW